MRLIKLAEYRRLYYAPGSEPCLNTLRKHINAIPGGRIERGHYYIDLDANDRANNLRSSIEDRQREVTDLLEGLL